MVFVWSEKKKNAKLKRVRDASDDDHEGRSRGQHKKSSKRRKKKKRRHYSSQSDSSSETETESSEIDSDSESDTSSASDSSGSSDDWRQRRKKYSKRDKYKRGKRKRDRKREKRHRRHEKKSRHKAKRFPSTYSIRYLMIHACFFFSIHFVCSNFLLTHENDISFLMLILGRRTVNLKQRVKMIAALMLLGMTDDENGSLRSLLISLVCLVSYFVLPHY